LEEKPVTLSFTTLAAPTGAVFLRASDIQPPLKVCISNLPSRSTQKLISLRI
jgi:hypothetical protein